MHQLKFETRERQGHIATLLLENRGSGTDWGAIGQLDGKPGSREIANIFLLCCLLDYQMISGVAWLNGYRLAQDILADQGDVWRAITSFSESEWKSKWDEWRDERRERGRIRLPCARTRSARETTDPETAVNIARQRKRRVGGKC